MIKAERGWRAYYRVSEGCRGDYGWVPVLFWCLEKGALVLDGSRLTPADEFEPEWAVAESFLGLLGPDEDEEAVRDQAKEVAEEEAREDDEAIFDSIAQKLRARRAEDPLSTFILDGDKRWWRDEARVFQDQFGWSSDLVEKLPDAVWFGWWEVRRHLHRA